MVLAWYQIGHKSPSYLYNGIHEFLLYPVCPCGDLDGGSHYQCPFGGVVMGLGIGFALRNNISSGGTDIVSLTIRKKTGKNVGSISFLVNGTIMLIAG